MQPLSSTNSPYRYLRKTAEQWKYALLEESKTDYFEWENIVRCNYQTQLQELFHSGEAENPLMSDFSKLFLLGKGLWDPFKTRGVATADLHGAFAAATFSDRVAELQFSPAAAIASSAKARLLS